MDYIIKLINKKQNLFNRWTWKMAWKDARYNKGRLLLFISSIVIGVAALVAIDAFNSNLQHDIDDQARELIGADLIVESDDHPFGDSTLLAIDTLTSDKAMDARFASMVYFPETGGSRLIRTVALKGDFPFYGKLEFTPESDYNKFKYDSAALIDEALAKQFNVEVNDSLRLGNRHYLIAGIVTQFPGNTQISTSFAPSVYIPYRTLDATGLIQYGSRVEYSAYYKLGDTPLEELTSKLEPIIKNRDMHYDTVEEEKEDMSEGFQNMYRFFKLLSFVALILGCIGVASSVHIYAREKHDAAAMMRCLGSPGWQVFNIFFIQIFTLGIIGSILGVALGVGIQYLLPTIVQDFLPIEVAIRFVPMAVAEGLIVGMIITTIFSILPLNNMRFVAPMAILRSAPGTSGRHSKFRYFVMLLILVFPWAFAVYQTDSWEQGSAFYGGLVLAFLCLVLLAKGLMMGLKKVFPYKAGFILRQSFANLFRPNNQTIVLVVVIGLGAFLITSMTLVQNSLLGQVEFTGSGERSNTVLFDIQPSQKDNVIKLANDYDMDIKQTVPIVTMRIESIRDKSVDTWQEDTSVHMSNRAMTREYRVTYRDSLIDTEEILKGELATERVEEGDSIFISIAEWMKESLKLELKDKVVFNVQGLPITTYVGSIRKVDWQRVQTNFTVVFPPGVLESAPQFYVLVSRLDDKEKAAAFQQELVRQFPNVSLIDLSQILKTLDDIFGKIAFVIRFMAMFSIITGLVVLAGAVINSKYARLKENALLRTIGAIRKQIVGMTVLEYGYLGLLAGLAGSLLALVAGWTLSKYFFDILFFPDFVSMAIIWLIIAALTIFIGWFNTRSILNRTPMEVLRRET